MKGNVGASTFIISDKSKKNSMHTIIKEALGLKIRTCERRFLLRMKDQRKLLAVEKEMIQLIYDRSKKS